MNLRRIWIMFLARNKEFFRDHAAFGWNFAFPFLIIIGFGIIFSDQHMQKFKVGIFPVQPTTDYSATTVTPTFLQDRAITLIPIADRDDGLHKIRLHAIDLLIDGEAAEPTYWVNDASPSGYIAERLYLSSLREQEPPAVTRQLVSGEQVRYIDWFFPGIMAMNMMFSALWGVGYIIVRYRKNGALKRLHATPLTAFEYLGSQLLSRIFLLMFTFSVVWFGCDLIFDFRMQGSLALFLFIFFLGGMSLCSIGLLLAARGTSEEFTSGVLNFISWPMMFLSEVWFSIEGAPQWVQQCAWLLPLTHLLKAARKVMNEGAGFLDVQLECGLMLLTTIVFIGLAAWLFSWNE